MLKNIVFVNKGHFYVAIKVLESRGKEKKSCPKMITMYLNEFKATTCNINVEKKMENRYLLNNV